MLSGYTLPKHDFTVANLFQIKMSAQDEINLCAPPYTLCQPLLLSFLEKGLHVAISIILAKWNICLSILLNINLPRHLCLPHQCVFQSLSWPSPPHLEILWTTSSVSLQNVLFFTNILPERNNYWQNSTSHLLTTSFKSSFCVTLSSPLEYFYFPIPLLFSSTP